MPSDPASPCPCGSGKPLAECCGPYLQGARPAPTAEALMRSRYSAYVLKDADYLVKTQSLLTRRTSDRENIEAWMNQATWLGLEVRSTSRGGPSDSEGEVEFVARYTEGGAERRHHERSRFVRESGRWYYVDGETPAPEPVRGTRATGRNELCPCGSGKKYKKCHGA